MTRTNSPERFSSRPPKRKHHDLSAEAPAKRKQHARNNSESGTDEAHIALRTKLPRQEHSYPSVNELKRRIRDVKRLLNRLDLPADARIVQERALAGYERDLAEETARRKRSEMIKRYHFVRFLGMSPLFSLQQNTDDFCRAQIRHQRTEETS